MQFVLPGVSFIFMFYSLLFSTDVRIGFVEGSYSVGEAAGTVSVSAGVLEGELGISTTFRLITADGTATGRINPTSAVPLSLFVIANNRGELFVCNSMCVLSDNILCFRTFSP